MTTKTPKSKRTKLEQYFRDRAAENWNRSRKRNAHVFLDHFGGKFTAYRLAAEKVAIDQSVNETINLIKI